MTTSWKIAAVMAAVVALAGGAVLAWHIITISTVGPSSFSTAGVVGASDLALRDPTCTSGKMANVWTAVTEASPGTRAEGVECACNDGATSLIYALTSTNTESTLSGALVARVTSAGPGTGTTCTFPTLNLDGTKAATAQEEIYFGPLAGLMAGDPAEGQQAGDRVLTAKGTGGACEKLCFSVVLPTTAGAETAALTNSTDVLFHHQQAP
jgi:hypothetical protein